MASVFHLCCDAFDIKQKIVTKYSELSESDKKLFFAAVTIQRVFRGYSTRKKIANWHKKAIIIQKHVRGWLVRIHLPYLLKAHFYDLSVKYYNEQATKIQALWRGYKIRKTDLSIYDMMAERQEIELASKYMQELMRKEFEKLHAGKWNEMKKCLHKVLEILFNRHHLIRTRIREGVFSKHGSDELSHIEKILKSFRFTEYMSELHKILNQEEEKSPMDTPTYKEFDLSTNIKSKPYERMLFSQD